MKKSALLAAAVSGMLLGGATAARAETGSSSNDSQLRPGHAQRMADPPAGDKHSCKGKNACKGKGGCKTDKHACKGQNDCKGQGGCSSEGHKEAPKK